MPCKFAYSYLPQIYFLSPEFYCFHRLLPHSKSGCGNFLLMTSSSSENNLKINISLALAEHDDPNIMSKWHIHVHLLSSAISFIVSLALSSSIPSWILSSRKDAVSNSLRQSGIFGGGKKNRLCHELFTGLPINIPTPHPSALAPKASDTTLTCLTFIFIF